MSHSKILTGDEIEQVLWSASPAMISRAHLQQIVRSLLKDMVAHGDLLSGPRNLFRIHDPIALYDDRHGLRRLRIERDSTGRPIKRLFFRGDRSFLAKAHYALETTGSDQDLELRSPLWRWSTIRQRLADVGVQLVAIPHDPSNLPLPTEPAANDRLPATWLGNQTPGSYGLTEALAVILKRQTIERYVPAAGLSQGQRWQTLGTGDLTALIRCDRALLRLARKTYLWFEGGVLFDLDWEAACLAMFSLDGQGRAPLSIGWDPDRGWLDWGDTHLPPSYAYWFCYHSQAETAQANGRYVPRQERQHVTTCLQKLGVMANRTVVRPSPTKLWSPGLSQSPYARSIPYGHPYGPSHDGLPSESTP